MPNKLIGVIGSHSDFPVERIRLSYDHHYMGSCSHDNTVRLWDVRYLYEEEEEDEDEGDEDEGDEGDEDEGDEDDEEKEKK